MGFNGLESIPNDAFAQNKQLLLVALDGNPLKTLPEQAFRHLEGSLRSLSVGGRALNCDCRLSWLIRWQQKYRMLISSRDRQPQLCAKPQHFRSLVSFAAIKPENLVCTVDPMLETQSSTLSYYQPLYNDTSMRSPTIRILLPSVSETTTIATTTTIPTTTTEYTLSRDSESEIATSEPYSEVTSTVTVMQPSTDLEGTESSLYTTTWKRSGTFGERFTSKYEEATTQTLNSSPTTNEHKKLSRQGYLPSIDQVRKTPYRNIRNRTQSFDKRRRYHSSAWSGSAIDEIQRMTTKPQPILQSSTLGTSINGSHLPPKGARFVDDTSLQMLESFSRPERVNVSTPIITYQPTDILKSTARESSSTSTTTVPPASSYAPEVAVQNNTRMSVSSLYRLATSRAPIVVAIFDFKSFDNTNSSVIQGSSYNNMSIIDKSPKLTVQTRPHNATTIHQINGTLTTTPKEVIEISELPLKSTVTIPTPLAANTSIQTRFSSTSIGPLNINSATATATTTTITTSTTTTTSKPTVSTLNGTFPRNLIMKNRQMRGEATGSSPSQIFGYHIRLPDLDQAAVMFAGFLCFIILVMAMSTIICLCCGSPERTVSRSGDNQANAITKSTTRLASFSSKSSSTGVPLSKKWGCFSFCCFSTSSTDSRPPIMPIRSLLHTTDDEIPTENTSSGSSNSDADVRHYGTKSMLIKNYELPRSFIKKSSSGVSGTKSRNGTNDTVEPTSEFWLSRAPSSCDSDKSFSPTANKNNRYNIGQAHRAYLTGHAPIQASLFVTNSTDQSSGTSSTSFLKTLKDLYPTTEVNNNRRIETAGRAIDDSSCSYLRDARTTLHHQSGRSFGVGRSLSIGRIPAVVSSLSSDLTPMSAEEHWPEPYTEPLEQEETDKQEAGSVYYTNELHSNNPPLRPNRSSLGSTYHTQVDSDKSAIYQSWVAGRRSARQPRTQYQCHELEYPSSPISIESNGGGLVRYRSIPSLSQHQSGATSWLRWADGSSLNQPVFDTFTSMDPNCCRDNQLESIYVTSSSKRVLH